jgi:hypothetical protein
MCKFRQLLASLAQVGELVFQFSDKALKLKDLSSFCERNEQKSSELSTLWYKLLESSKLSKSYAKTEVF